MGELIVLGKRDKLPEGFIGVDVTSRNTQLKHMFSPFYLSNIECYDGLYAMNMENAWQYSKVYVEYTSNGEPTREYINWRNYGWNKVKADRRPMGRQKPLYSIWKINGEYKKLGYIDARKNIYMPLYAKAVTKSGGVEYIRNILQTNNVALIDFDGYNHKALGMSYHDVVNAEHKIMGHGFVLAMLVEGYMTA